MTPAVSVVMPVYNAERWLEEALCSALGQTVDDLELIVVDDGSTDGSLAIAERVAGVDSRVRVVRSRHQGIAGTLNRGVAECRAPIMARLDADDVAQPRRLELQLAYLAGHPECVGVGGQVDMIDEEGDSFGWILNPLDHDALVAALRRSSCALPHTTATLRVAAVRAVGGYRSGLLAEDVDLFLRMSEVGRLANLPNHVGRYRKHEGSLTATWSADGVRTERQRRARGCGVREIDWVQEPRGEALLISRLGLALHAGRYRTAGKYCLRLLDGRVPHPRLAVRMASRIARSLTHRILQAPQIPAP